MGHKEDRQTGHLQKRRLEVLEKANWTCEDCGAGMDKFFDVHHTAYVPNLKAWEYSDDFLMALCRECHESRQLLENGIRANQGRITRNMSRDRLYVYFWTIAKEAAESDHSRMIRLMQEEAEGGR